MYGKLNLLMHGKDHVGDDYRSILSDISKLKDQDLGNQRQQVQRQQTGSRGSSYLERDPSSPMSLIKTTRSSCLDSFTTADAEESVSSRLLDAALPSSSRNSISDNDHLLSIAAKYLFWVITSFKIDRLLHCAIEFLENNIHRFPALLKFGVVRELVRKNSDQNLASGVTNANMSECGADDGDDENEYCFVSPVSVATTSSSSSSDGSIDPADNNNESDDSDEESWGHFADFQEFIIPEDTIPSHDPFQSLLRHRCSNVHKLSVLTEEEDADYEE
jgi:hypothetical protein